MILIQFINTNERLKNEEIHRNNLIWNSSRYYLLCLVNLSTESITFPTNDLFLYAKKDNPLPINQSEDQLYPASLQNPACTRRSSTEIRIHFSLQDFDWFSPTPSQRHRKNGSDSVRRPDAEGVSPSFRPEYTVAHNVHGRLMIRSFILANLH